MASVTWLLLQAAAISVAIAYLAFNKQSRAAILNRLRVRRRRDSGSRTPPRSLTPDIKDSTAAPDYRDVFPPSRRCAFQDCHQGLAEKLGVTREELCSSPPDSRSRCLPIDQPFDDAHSAAHTCTEFSVEEIRAMGDFPDYAALSGVRLPVPYEGFDIAKAKPRPYRPLRWAYHQTMSLTKLEPDWWLELESTYAARIRQRQQLFKDHGKTVLDYLPGSELACKELMEMCLEFVAARYPQSFELDKQGMLFHNRILGTTAELKKEHPLHVILDHIPEDFAIMLRDPADGSYRFRAGVICSSLGWNLGTKFDKRLHEIHEPIPDYKEKMQFSMDRYFAKKPTDKAIQRGSWGLEVDEPLFMPPGDPHEKYRDIQAEDIDESRLNLRVDWQTLRRLPLSGAVIFNFKAVFTPVTTFRDEPYIPTLLLKVLREGKKSLMEYKNTWHTEHKVIPLMEAYEKEQIANGLVAADWEPHTLEESPFFPGWEEKWHREQGF